MTPDQVTEAQRRVRDWAAAFDERSRSTVAAGTSAAAAPDCVIRGAKRVKEVKPIYPEEAQARIVRGEVWIEGVIGPDGKVKVAWVTRSIPGLNRAALEAVKKWEFIPACVDDLPAPSTVTLVVKFTLK